jgi:hypothetical protein
MSALANFGLGLRTWEPQASHMPGASILVEFLCYHAILTWGMETNIRKRSMVDLKYIKAKLYL